MITTTFQYEFIIIFDLDGILLT